MIHYEAGDYQFSFVFNREGSVVLRGVVFSLPSAALAMGWRYSLEAYPSYFVFLDEANFSAIWSVTTLCLAMMIGFRLGRAYSRFWEGITLVQMMRAEWFEACSNLTAFSKHALSGDSQNIEMQRKVMHFQALLVRLMSLMHGTALRQIGGNCEEFEVIDIHGLDDESLTYLAMSEDREVNVVEVLLHWIQVLITDSIASGVMCISPSILTRPYMTLSRGMVNLHDAKKIAEVPFPFPLSQLHVILLWVHCFITPFVAAYQIPNMIVAGLVTVVPICGMWSLLFINGEFEQPFGEDANDLPLSSMQFDFNNSLLMLLEPESMCAPILKDTAPRNVWELRAGMGDPTSTTEQGKLLAQHLQLGDEGCHSVSSFGSDSAGGSSYRETPVEAPRVADRLYPHDHYADKNKNKDEDGQWKNQKDGNAPQHVKVTRRRSETNKHNGIVAHDHAIDLTVDDDGCRRNISNPSISGTLSTSGQSPLMRPQTSPASNDLQLRYEAEFARQISRCTACSSAPDVEVIPSLERKEDERNPTSSGSHSQPSSYPSRFESVRELKARVPLKEQADQAKLSNIVLTEGQAVVAVSGNLDPASFRQLLGVETSSVRPSGSPQPSCRENGGSLEPSEPVSGESSILSLG